MFKQIVFRLVVGVLSVHLIVGMLFPVAVQAEIDLTSLSFLNIQNSARSAALGNAGLTLLDPTAQQYNPGAMGIFHLEKILSFAGPHSTDWLPSLANDMEMNTWSGGVGLSRSTLSPGKEPDFDFGIAMGYSLQRFSFGMMNATNPLGEPIGTFESYNRSRNYTFAVGVVYRRAVYVGFGYTHKDLLSVLAEPGSGTEIRSSESEGSAHDIGLMVRANVGQIMPLVGLGTPWTENSPLTFDIEPSFGFVIANQGDDFSYIDAVQADPLPEMRRMGVGILVSVNSKAGPLVSANLVSDWEKSTVGGSIGEYVSKQGIELGLLGTVYLRTGWLNDDPGKLDVTTRGIGFSTQGLTRRLGLHQSVSTTNWFLQRFTRTLEITVDYAKHFDEGGPWDGTEYFQVTASL